RINAFIMVFKDGLHVLSREGGHSPARSALAAKGQSVAKIEFTVVRTEDVDLVPTCQLDLDHFPRNWLLVGQGMRPHLAHRFPLEDHFLFPRFCRAGRSFLLREWVGDNDLPVLLLV